MADTNPQKKRTTTTDEFKIQFHEMLHKCVNEIFNK